MPFNVSELNILNYDKFLIIFKVFQLDEEHGGPTMDVVKFPELFAAIVNALEGSQELNSHATINSPADLNNFFVQPLKKEILEQEAKRGTFKILELRFSISLKTAKHVLELFKNSYGSKLKGYTITVSVKTREFGL